MQTGIPPSEYVRAIQETGSIAAAARKLGVSRQTIYDKCEVEPDVAAAVASLRKEADPQAVRECLSKTNAALRVQRADVDARLANHEGESFLMAAKEVLIERLQERLNLSKREVLAQLHAHQKAMEMFLALLPPPPAKETKEQVTVTLTHEESTWIRAQSKGYAADLFRTLPKLPPAATALPPPECTTSFLLGADEVATLKEEAQAQGVTPTILFRTVVRTAMQMDRARHTHHRPTPAHAG